MGHGILIPSFIWYLDMGFPGGSDYKESACNVGDLGSVSGLGMATHSSILAYRIPMDREACQAPLSLKFSRQEYWSGFPPPGIFLIQKSNPGFLHCRQILYSLSHQGREL